MAKITIEFDDDLMANFLEQIGEQAAASGGDVKKDKPASKKTTTKKDTGGAGTGEQIKELCNQLLELTDKTTVKGVTSEFDCTTVAKACKLEGEDAADCIEALQEAIEEAGEGGEPGEEEITVDAVKVAVQAYSKKNGKEACTELLEDFNIKSVRGLGKLSQDELEELYAEVCE